MTLASHRLLLDLMALEAEFSRVIMLNSGPPLIPENQKVSQDLVAAHELVRAWFIAAMLLRAMAEPTPNWRRGGS